MPTYAFVGGEHAFMEEGYSLPMSICWRDPMITGSRSRMTYLYWGVNWWCPYRLS